VPRDEPQATIASLPRRRATMWSRR
jgi:hypothetical protein